MNRANEHFRYMIDFIKIVTGVTDDDKIKDIEQQLLIYTHHQNIEYSLTFNEVKNVLSKSFGVENVEAEK